MNKNFYLYAILFSILTILVGLVQRVIQTQIGNLILELETLPIWIFLFILVFVSMASYDLRYYHFRKYRTTFVTATIAAIASLTYLVATLIFIWNRSSSEIMPVVFFFSIAAAFAFGTSLAFSRSAERSFLKAAGIVIMVSALAIVIVGIVSITDLAAIYKISAQKLYLYQSWVELLIPVLTTANYWSEWKAAPREEIGDPWGFVFGAVLLLCVTGAFTAGISLLNESFYKKQWLSQLPVKAREYEQIFETVTYSGAKGEKLRYQLLKPVEIDSLKSYPLVVCLPFNGGVEGCPPAEWLMDEVNRSRFPAFIFVPSCPEGAGWGGVPNYPVIDEIVFDAIVSIESKYPQIDPNRCYVTGVSRGGYGSWHFITTRPDLFAAAVPICGGGDSTKTSLLNDVDVWAFHGTKDKNVPVDLSRSMIRSMRRNGFDPHYTEFENGGHNIWDNVKSTSGLLTWLFAQKKDSASAVQ